LPELEGALEPLDMPVVPGAMALPGWFFMAGPALSVVRPSIESPVVVLLAAGPPAFELPPAVLPADCASAAVLPSAGAESEMTLADLHSRSIAWPISGPELGVTSGS
jgi:hypothetical protein